MSYLAIVHLGARWGNDGMKKSVLSRRTAATRGRELRRRRVLQMVAEGAPARPTRARSENPPLTHAAGAIGSEITAGDTDASVGEAAGGVTSEEADMMRAQMLAASARGTHIDEVAEAADQDKENEDKSVRKWNIHGKTAQKGGKKRAITDS